MNVPKQYILTPKARLNKPLLMLLLFYVLQTTHWLCFRVFTYLRTNLAVQCLSLNIFHSQGAKHSCNKNQKLGYKFVSCYTIYLTFTTIDYTLMSF